MKILFIASVYNHLTAFHIPYMQLLQNKGYEVWAAGAEDERVKKDLADLNIICIDIPFERSPFSTNNVKAYRKLKRLFAAEDFQMVHVNTPIAAFLTRFAFRHSKKRKMIYTAHGFHFYKGAPVLNWLIYYPLERLASSWTDALITINKEDYEKALTMGFRDGSVHFVPGVGVNSLGNQMDRAERDLFKIQLGLSEEAFVISYIAELNKNKNHEFLLRNWKGIKEKCPEATLLVIGHGIMRSEIERHIIEQQLEDIHLLGFRNDVNNILGITDVVCLLSQREGLPKSIMEAMIAGIPCVVSDTRGLRDLIIDGENGFVVPHGSNDALIESFVKLGKDNDMRIRMGRTALRRVEPYRLENVIKEYSSIYEKMLTKGLTIENHFSLNPTKEIKGMEDEKKF